MVSVTGVLLCTAWYGTILAGFFLLYCPVLYLMFINHRLYRKAADFLFALWELYPVALFQCILSTQLHHYGDYIDPDETAIIIMNHRTRVDWNYAWIMLYHATDNYTCACKRKPNTTENSVLDLGGRAKLKFVLKDEIKGIPGLGWIMQLNCFLYVKRQWREDQASLTRFVAYYTSLLQPIRVLLFPEGTDLSDDNRRKSDKFAEKHNLPARLMITNINNKYAYVVKYTYVLHPRTTGWAALCSRMRETSSGLGLMAVYDVTLAYDTPPQTEAHLLSGCTPKHVYAHIKRYSIEQLPLEEEPLRRWLTDRWADKETNLCNFFANDFISNSTNRMFVERTPSSMLKAKLGLVFWTFTDFLFLITLMKSVLFQFWVIYHSLLFVFVTKYLGGFENIQYKL